MLRDAIKDVLDRECRERYLQERYQFESSNKEWDSAPLCDAQWSYPNTKACWMCHKHDALAQEIAEIREVHDA